MPIVGSGSATATALDGVEYTELGTADSNGGGVCGGTTNDCNVFLPSMIRPSGNENAESFFEASAEEVVAPPLSLSPTAATAKDCNVFLPSMIRPSGNRNGGVLVVAVLVVVFVVVAAVDS